jgi:hypothetical protein
MPQLKVGIGIAKQLVRKARFSALDGCIPCLQIIGGFALHQGQRRKRESPNKTKRMKNDVTVGAVAELIDGVGSLWMGL